MKFPTIKQFQQWTPMIGAAAFTLWTLLLVVLSLLPVRKEAVLGRETKPMPTMQAPVAASGCVTVSGLLICDELPGQGG